jgi:hypothetical protein
LSLRRIAPVGNTVTDFAFAITARMLDAGMAEAD